MKITAQWEEDEYDFVSTVFPGHATTTSANAFIKGALAQAAVDASYVVELRHMTAMSGAMRWPWSQEAAIRIRNEVRIQ